MKHLHILLLILICMLSLGLLGCAWNSEDVKPSRNTINSIINYSISDSTKTFKDSTKLNDKDTTKYPIGFDININDWK